MYASAHFIHAVNLTVHHEIICRFQLQIQRRNAASREIYAVVCSIVQPLGIFYPTLVQLPAFIE